MRRGQTRGRVGGHHLLRSIGCREIRGPSPCLRDPRTSRPRDELGFSLRQLRLNPNRPTAGQENQMGKKLFVGNLAFTTTGSDLEAVFAAAGTVESANVISDRES